MSLSSFKSHVDSISIARNNRYEIAISASKVGIVVDPTNQISLFVKSVNLPTLSLMTFEHNTYGEFRTVPYQKRYDPVTLTFYVATDFDIQKKMYDWMNKVYHPINRTSGFYDEYAKNNKMTLTIYNVDEGQPPIGLPSGTVYYYAKHEIEFFEVYPKAIQEIQLDAAKRDEMTLSVTFNYKYFKSTTFPNVISTVP